MKILVIHNTGNVGKSFLAREPFYQNMESEDKLLLEVESHNSSSSKFKGINIEKVGLRNGDALSQITHFSMIYDDFVMDVGVSQIEAFLIALKKTPEILDEFDVIIVPIIKDTKIITDTVKTLTVLNAFGVIEKTRVVFNKMDSPSTIGNDFAKFLAWTKKEGISIDMNLYLGNYEAAEDLSKLNLLSGEILADSTDYKALSIQAHKEGDTKKSLEMSNKLLTQRIAKSLNASAKELYEKLKDSL